MNKFVIENTFHYGYCPTSSCIEIPPVVHQSIENRPQQGFDNLVSAGARAIQRGMDSLWDDESSTATHILPLSGGLDSRMVLCLLLDRVPRDQILTVTYGIPGAWDYEIGQQVAEEAGVRNISYNLWPSNFNWSEDGLRSYAASLSHPTRIITGYVNQETRSRAHDEIEGDVVHWSGFMGDPLAGAHLSEIDPQISSWSEACAEFGRWDSVAGALTTESFDPVAALPDEPLLPLEKLGYGEQLDYSVRQQCMIKPMVQHRRVPRTPFLTEDFASFMISAPLDQRRERTLFKKIAIETYPRLFSLPTETNRGLSLAASEWRYRLQYLIEGVKYAKRYLIDDLAITPQPQHIDFEIAFRNQNHLSKLVHNLVTSFAERDVAPWISPCEYWDKHQRGDGDFSFELRMISSLELFAQTH